MFKGSDLSNNVLHAMEKNCYVKSTIANPTPEEKVKAIYDKIFPKGSWFQGVIKDSMLSAIKSTIKDIMRQDKTLKLARFVWNESGGYREHSPFNIQKFIDERIKEINKNGEYKELTPDEIKIAFREFQTLHQSFSEAGVFDRIYDVQTLAKNKLTGVSGKDNFVVDKRSGIKIAIVAKNSLRVNFNDPRIIDAKFAKSFMSKFNLFRIGSSSLSNKAMQGAIKREAIMKERERKQEIDQENLPIKKVSKKKKGGIKVVKVPNDGTSTTQIPKYRREI